ncbi:Sec-independent protein translocase protein TatB [Sphingomonas xinjiangensis]|uniref:Sec-independent protein translocase protein TatB n=1 Tax=Sphingomonas xinjiangensis TaxID=643568 RepID=A0A840YBB0_9SPHN|nr:Sec-independent protein translocase protein TatB [Sphingomonas xinjiangensis]MBB5710627.1 sec-independent protein translocase protein TatB [Sphingomonas xinjiangensis]
MFDVAPQELLLVAVVALLVIGPKDLPRAMHFVGKWVGKARGVARQFRSGMDTMIREAELAEMEEKWKAENERIMREHPPTPSLPAPEDEAVPHGITADGHADASHDPEPVMVAKPDIHPEPAPILAETKSPALAPEAPLRTTDEVRP